MRFLGLIPAALLLTGASSSHSPVPRISFAATGLLENYCREVSPVKPVPAALEEVRRRVPEFTAAWQRDGEPLLRATLELTGVPFSFREELAVLHTCPDLESLSGPLAIAVARYTEAVGGAAVSSLVRRRAAAGEVPIPHEPPKPMSDFVYVVWHELLHRYTVDLKAAVGDRPTPLLTRYSAENETVRWHLYLYAVERLALRRLGRESEYFAREAEMRARGNANSHLRAAEIVDREGAEVVLADLRAVLKKH